MNLTKEKNKVFSPVFFIIAVLFGILTSVSSGLVFVLFLIALLLFFTLRNTPSQDRHFVVSLMVTAILMRLIVLVFVQIYCYPRTENVIYAKLDIFGDAQDNIFKGLHLGDYLQGKVENTAFAPDGIFGRAYNIHGKTFFNGLYFAAFGKDIISLKFINFLAVMLTAWFAYDFTRRVYSSPAGKLAMAFILFWPTIFLWSVTDLKDSHFILSVMGLLWSQEKISSARENKPRLKYFIYFAIFSLYALSLRFNLMEVVFFLLFVFICLRLAVKNYVCAGNHHVARLILFSAFILFIIFALRDSILPYALNAHNTFININQGFLKSGGINYDLFSGETDIYNFILFPKYIYLGFVHFLLEPFIWKNYPLSMHYIFPQIFVWYVMLFWSTVGLFNIYQNKNFKKIIFMFFLLIFYIMITGILVPNIGTVIRLRDSIFPIVAILAACGILGQTAVYAKGGDHGKGVF